MSGINDIELGIYWDKLTSINDQMTHTLARTSFSPIIREAYDLNVVIVNKSGKLISEASFSMPIFTRLLSTAAKNLIETFESEGIEEGDVLVSNDPWSETTHQYDIAIIRPVFVDGELLAFTGAMVHLSDIGGRPYTAYSESHYEEGLIIPPSKLVEAGEPNRDIFNIIRANVRVPDEVVGDIKACLAATYSGGEDIAEFVREYGVDFDELGQRILEKSRSNMERAIADLPSGTYSGEMTVGGIDRDLTFQSEITVSDRTIEVDYAGSDPQVRHAINVPLLYTQAFTQYPIKCITTPDTLETDGDYEPISVTAPEGSFLNPRPPAPIASRQAIGHFCTVLTYRILADAMPERVMADPGMVSLHQLTYSPPGQDGYSMIVFGSGGLAATASKDGADTTAAPTNFRSIPLEAIEAKTGNIRFQEKRLLPDSGGDGRYRGGLGQRMRYTNVGDDPVTLNLMTVRTRYEPEGALGGRPGACRTMWLNEEAIPDKTVETLDPGDELTIEEAGGGGFFDPAKRDRESIIEDLVNGKISAEKAAEVYEIEDPESFLQ
jgi:N-methylhydantoinase B